MVRLTAGISPLYIVRGFGVSPQNTHQLSTNSRGVFYFRRVRKLFLCSLIVSGLLGVSLGRAQTTDLVSTQVDGANRVVLSGHHPSWAVAANDIGVVPDDVSLGRFTLVLSRTVEREAAFEQLLKDQQTLGSPTYHRWLTPAQIGQQFGASPHDLAAIKNWLESQGLHRVSVANSGDRIHFIGPASAVGSAFGAHLHYYVVKGEQRMSISSDPQIPKALAGIGSLLL